MTRIIVTCAIICITILEAIALFQGHDGMLLTTMVGIIAGLAGWTAPTPNFIKQ